MPVLFPLHLVKHLGINNGTLTLKEGTRVGGSQENIAIGGMDNPVIRDPLTKHPYIPGSSLKGKFRSSLEYKYKKGMLVTNRERQLTAVHPCDCAEQNCPICVLCGPHMKPRHNLGPSRLIFRDSFLLPDSVKALEALQAEGLPLVEVKTENMINRKGGIAESPRQMERVPKGAKFDFNLTIRVFEGDSETQIRNWVDEGLKEIQKEGLGGSITRGSGWFSLDYEIKDL